MAAERENYRPYRESGRFARAGLIADRKRTLLIDSLRDADELETHAHVVMRRGARNRNVAVAVFVSCLALAALLVPTAISQPQTYEGVVRANWSILGVVVLLMALNFIWAWCTRSVDLIHTGRRLLRRAEYQRARATFQLKEEQ